MVIGPGQQPYGPWARSSPYFLVRSGLKKRKRKKNEEPRSVELMTAQSVRPPVSQTCLGPAHIAGSGQPIYLIIYLIIIIYIIILYNIKKFKNSKKFQGSFQNISNLLACFLPIFLNYWVVFLHSKI
jgi:hypothetical protein